MPPPIRRPNAVKKASRGERAPFRNEFASPDLPRTRMVGRKIGQFRREPKCKLSFSSICFLISVENLGRACGKSSASSRSRSVPRKALSQRAALVDSPREGSAASVLLGEAERCSRLLKIARLQPNNPLLSPPTSVVSATTITAASAVPISGRKKDKSHLGRIDSRLRKDTVEPYDSHCSLLADGRFRSTLRIRTDLQITTERNHAGVRPPCYRSVRPPSRARSSFRGPNERRRPILRP